MSSKSYFEMMCANVYWLIRGHRIDVTRLSRRSFTWKVTDENGITLKIGKSTSAEGAFRTARLQTIHLKAVMPHKNRLVRLWQWLKGQQHDN